MHCIERRLQKRAMDDLHVDNELAAMITDDKDTHATTAGLESFGKAGPERGLLDDREILLDVAGFGHCDNYSNR